MQSFRSVLIGLGMSLFVPRLAGESLGRYTSHQGDKKDVVSGLVVTKIVQTIVTFLFGCIGVLYYQKNLAFLFVLPNYWFLFLILLLITSFLLLRKKIIMLIQDSPYLYSIRQLSLTKTRNLFFVSIFRYLTFYIQFGLACLLIGVELDVYEGFFALAILFFFFFSTISINVVVDLGVRFATALLVFSTLGIIQDTNVIVSIFSLVWLFNVVLPSLIGGVLIWRKK